MNLLEAFVSSLPSFDAAASYVRDYFTWQQERHAVDFIPSTDDDVDLLTYLFYLYANGTDQAELAERAAALKQFYRWAQTNGVITRNPFDNYSLDQPFLASAPVQPPQQAPPGESEKAELQRLRALNQIDEQLISSLDIQSALDNTLKILLEVMHLQTGWISMRTESHLGVIRMADPPPHGFALATAHGLPPALKHDDCRFLRQPPACHCQSLLREGRLTRPVNIFECTRLRDALDASGDTQGLRFHASAPLISQGKPVGLINVATADWRQLTQADLQFLFAASVRLVAALERAHFYEIAEARRVVLENELKIAGAVQAGLMQCEMPEIPGYSFACAWHPAGEVAGDFYNVFPLEKGRWCIVIGDVADHGAAAALYMAMVQSLILSGALRKRSPAAVLKEVNQTLLKQTPSLIFVTVFLAIVDPKEQTLQYANAGHNPPLVRNASNSIVLLRNTGSVIGVLDDLELSDVTINLEPGDAVVLYTDGVTEAWQPQQQNQEYGLDRLTASLAAAPRKAGELLAHIKADLKAFTGGAPQQDDVTLLVITKD